MAKRKRTSYCNVTEDHGIGFLVLRPIHPQINSSTLCNSIGAKPTSGGIRVHALAKSYNVSHMTISRLSKGAYMEIRIVIKGTPQEGFRWDVMEGTNVLRTGTANSQPEAVYCRKQSNKRT
jgi:hypothetical protein